MHRLGGEQLAGADDDEVVGEHGELGDQVAGHEHRAALVGEAAQRGAQPADAVGVESVGRLVEQQHLGFAEQGAGEGEALAHAEREAAGALVGGAGEADLARSTSSTRPAGMPLSAAAACRWLRARAAGVHAAGVEHGADDAGRVAQSGVG